MRGFRSSRCRPLHRRLAGGPSVPPAAPPAAPRPAEGRVDPWRSWSSEARPGALLCDTYFGLTSQYPEGAGQDYVDWMEAIYQGAGGGGGGGVKGHVECRCREKDRRRRWKRKMLILLLKTYNNQPLWGEAFLFVVLGTVQVKLLISKNNEGHECVMCVLLFFALPT